MKVRVNAKRKLAQIVYENAYQWICDRIERKWELIKKREQTA
jgi:hypothetical protein